MRNELKFGVADYGMDVWDGGCYHLERRLELLKSCGFDGIEWLKVSDMSDAVHNASVFHRMGMDFSSCSMPNPELTLKCACAFGKEYVWFPMRATRDIPFEDYCRRANGFVKAAAAYNVRAALHNHLGARVESPEELDAFMRAVPDACLLLDTGHLAAAGGNCAEFIGRYFDRIAAIHFKDVFIKDESIGLDRWGERLRFCELGGGNCSLDFDALGAILRRKGYAKWALVEHDTHLRAPEIDLKCSLDILKKLFDL